MMTATAILWLTLGLNVVTGITLAVVLRMSNRITTMRDNELKHMLAAIDRLTARFDRHIEQHPQ